MHDSLELEGKFACTEDDLEQAALLEQIGDFHLQSHDARIQTDIYFDTPDLTLRGSSSSLRLREVGANTKATFKGPRQVVSPAEDASHLVKRLEIEVPVVPPPTDHQAFVKNLDIEPVRRAREIVTDVQDLQAIARLVTHRRMLHFERANGDEVELSLDRVEAVDLRNGKETRLIEIELELIEGTEAALIAAATLLRDAIPSLRPSSTSKLARVLGANS